MAFVKVTDASGREWQFTLNPQTVCSIGRAPDNCIILDDPRASRHHAHLRFDSQTGAYQMIDGVYDGNLLRRSANKVFINGQPHFEYTLNTGDRILIGGSQILFEQDAAERAADLRYDDKPLGHTQLLISANDVVSHMLRSKPSIQTRDKEVEALRRKAEILAELYEMSKTLGSVFDLQKIFAKATDIIFRVTPADRVVALLTDTTVSPGDEIVLRPIATRARDEKLEAHAKRLTIGRTITRKVMKERVASLSTMTVHAPHSATPQPYLVPVRPTSSRRNQSSERSGSPSQFCSWPLIFTLIMIVSSLFLSC